MRNNSPTAGPIILIAGTIIALAFAGLLLNAEAIWIIAGLAGIVVVWLVFEYPFAGVVLYIIIQYFRPGEMFPVLEPLRPALGVVALVGLSFVLRFLVGREFTLVRHRILLAMGFFIITIGLSIPFAVYRSGALDTFTIMVRLAVGLFLILHIVDNWTKLRWLLWFWMGTLASLATWNNILYYGGLKEELSDTGGSSGMIGGFMGDGNDFSLGLGVAIPLGLIMFRIEPSKFGRWFGLFCALMSIISIIATTSRGGFVALAASMIVVVMVHRRSIKTISMLALTGMVLALSIFLAAPGLWEEKFAPSFSTESNPFLSRIAELDQVNTDESTIGRLDAWRAAVDMFIDHPIIGVGAGCFDTAYGLFYKPPDAVTAKWRAAHSIYFQILGELGFLGVAGQLLIFLTIFGALQRLRSRNMGESPKEQYVHGLAGGLLGGVVFFAVGGLFLSAFYYPHIYYLGTWTVALVTIYQKGANPFDQTAEISEDPSSDRSEDQVESTGSWSKRHLSD